MKELVVFCFQGLLHCVLFVDGPEQLIVMPDESVPDESAADGARNWLICAYLEHAFEANIAKEVLIDAGQHRPSSHDVVGLKTDITKRNI